MVSLNIKPELSQPLQRTDRKPNHNFYSNQLLITIFPKFCSCFCLRTNQRKQNMLSKPTTQAALILVSPPPASPSSTLQSRAHLKPSLFFTMKLSHSPTCLSFCEKQVMVADSIAIASFAYITCACSHWGGLYYVHTPLRGFFLTRQTLIPKECHKEKHCIRAFSTVSHWKIAGYCQKDTQENNTPQHHSYTYQTGGPRPSVFFDYLVPMDAEQWEATENKSTVEFKLLQSITLPRCCDNYHHKHQSHFSKHGQTPAGPARDQNTHIQLSKQRVMCQ